VTKLFCHDRDPNTPPPNDAPDPLDYHAYHSAAFAAAAGVTLESLTQPTAQPTPHPCGDAGGGGGDDGGGAAGGADGGSNAAGWDLHGRDEPEEPDPLYATRTDHCPIRGVALTRFPFPNAPTHPHVSLQKCSR
jgi:hypothetical protein